MPDKLKVFLCHSSGDKPTIRELYKRLNTEGWIQPWLDEEDLIPGQSWRDEIEKAVETSQVILICLTPASVTKEGYIQREIKVALDHADYIPEGTIYIIPVRLEHCEIPRRLKNWQWVNYYEEGSYEKLLRGLKLRAEGLGIPTEAATTPPPNNQPMPPASSGLNPKDEAEIYYKRGIAHYKLKNYQYALDDFERVIQLDPTNADYHNRKGWVNDASGKYQEAIEDYNRAIQLNPKEKIYYFNRGNAYTKLEHYERTIKDYDKAIELDPYFAFAYENRGNAYNALKQYELAVKDYDKAVELGLNDADTYNNRGNAYKNLGNKEAARRDFQRAADLGYEDAKNELKKL